MSALGLKDVILNTSGGALRGWTGIDVDLSLEQASNTFSFTSSDYRKINLFDHPAKLDASCQVLFGDTMVINGYIEQLNPDYSKDAHQIKVSGRDITCDIVDSSAVIPNQELRNVTIADAAKQLCAPHGISVDCPAPGAPFEIWSVNDGESVFDSIEQHARQRQLLMYTHGDGVLHIKKAEPQALSFCLEEGKNILQASATHQSNQQFGQYIVKSQKEKGEHNLRKDTAGTHPRANRILIVRPEKPDDASECGDRGEWEKKVRKARARRATVTVNGWESTSGLLWRPLQMPMLISPRLGFNGNMLITSVKLHVDEGGGALATLELCDPEVYT